MPKPLKKDQRVRIRQGWEGAGRIGTVLGDTVFTEQDWTPLRWDDEEDPDFHMTAGLEPLPKSQPLILELRFAPKRSSLTRAHTSVEVGDDSFVPNAIDLREIADAAKAAYAKCAERAARKRSRPKKEYGLGHHYREDCGCDGCHARRVYEGRA